MANALVDSSILIDYLRGHPGADDFLAEQRSQGSVATHIVAHAELLSGARDQRELDRIDVFFADFTVHDVAHDDTLRSLDLLRRYRLSHRVGWLDCLIAATAIRLGTAVATLNEKHFRIFEQLQVIRPY